MTTATKPARTPRHRETWPSREIYHVWAHQRAGYGRATGVKVFFDGPVIFSYGRHFPMAKLLLKRGVPVAVLMTTRRYSTTTAGHLSDVRSAINHLTTFRVSGVLEKDHKKHLTEYRQRIADAAEEAKRAKGRTLYILNGIDQTIAEGDAYAKFFGLKTRFTYPKGFDVEAERARGTVEAEKQQERNAARDRNRSERYAAQEAARAARLEQERAEYPAKFVEYERLVAAWLDGQGNTFPTAPRDPDGGWDATPTLARLRVRRSRIETSKGAVVNVESAKPLLILVRRAGPGHTSLPDIEIDGYRGGSTDGDKRLLTVGCHRIEFDEIERIAAQLGL